VADETRVVFFKYTVAIRRGTGADRKPLYRRACDRRRWMVAPNKNVVTIHRTTFTAERNSTAAPKRHRFFEFVERFKAEISRRFVRRPKRPAENNVVRRLADYRRARQLSKRR
jgi:hypothetical protein